MIENISEPMIPVNEKEKEIVDGLAEYIQDHEREAHSKILDRLMAEHVIDLPTAEKYLKMALWQTDPKNQYYYLLTVQQRQRARELHKGYYEYWKSLNNQYWNLKLKRW